MYISTEKVRNVAVSATDGLLGKVDQFFFDSGSWAIRYIVVEMGPLLSTQKKLLSPRAIQSIGPEELRVNISKDQLRRSPDVDADQPVSRQKELEIHKHFGWSFYWDNPDYATTFGTSLYPGMNIYPDAPRDTDRNDEKNRQDLARECEPEKRCLRSTKKVTGYTVVAQDQEIGSVKEFLFDDEHWVLRYIIAETGPLLASKKHILSSQWSQKIEWRTNRIYFDIDPTIIKHGPPYDTGILISRTYEKELYDYYHKPYYW
jgi:uncharacterized protein YrrD